jgi:hypothetical protein
MRNGAWFIQIDHNAMRAVYTNSTFTPYGPETGTGCLSIAVAGWMNQMIDYLREENRIVREQLDGRRLRINDDQRRRLAVKPSG